MAGHLTLLSALEIHWRSPNGSIGIDLFLTGGFGKRFAPVKSEAGLSDVTEGVFLGMVQVHSAEDWPLVEAIGQQNQGALSRLYDRYARVLYTLAYRILGSAEEAEEVVLDVFSKVWINATTYDPSRGRVDHWLFMMARSRALDRLRSRQRRDRVVDVSTQQAQVEPISTPLPEEDLVIQERRDRVQGALAQIPAEQRTVIELAYFSGLSQSEIATQTGLSLGTVKTRTRLGLTKLRTLLDSA